MKVLLFSLLIATQAVADQRIVGGNDVYPPGKWPWQGSLQVFSPSPGGGSYSHNCGCVVVNNTQVLTSAACAQGYAVEDLRVTLGAHDLETRIEGDPEDYSVINSVIHEEFENSPVMGFPNDVAVLTLDSEINFNNEYIDMVTMPEYDLDDEGHAGQECVITGWGQQTGGGALANILKEADTDVITNTDCLTYFTQINDGHVCVIDVEAQETGACNGDGGGPLVCRETPDDEWILVGLSSWLASGCSTDQPSVYSRVAYFREWFDWAMQQ